mgnify:CR=1 FL=1
MSKYSSYKEHQLITESWRKFLAEEQGPEQTLGRWAQMFPDAAGALESIGVVLADILDVLAKDSYDPEMGVDTRDDVERPAAPRSTGGTSQGRPSGFPHKFEE